MQMLLKMSFGPNSLIESTLQPHEERTYLKPYAVITPAG